MNRMNLLDLDNDCLNIIGNIVKRENKRTEIIEEAFEHIMNKEETDTEDMRLEILDFFDSSNYDEIYEDFDKVLEKLREAGYDLTEYDEQKGHKRSY